MSCRTGLRPLQQGALAGLPPGVVPAKLRVVYGSLPVSQQALCPASCLYYKTACSSRYSVWVVSTPAICSQALCPASWLNLKSACSSRHSVWVVSTPVKYTPLSAGAQANYCCNIFGLHASLTSCLATVHACRRGSRSRVSNLHEAGGLLTSMGRAGHGPPRCYRAPM